MLHYDINDDDLLNERGYGPSEYGVRDRVGGAVVVGGAVSGSGVGPVGVASSSSSSHRHNLNSDIIDNSDLLRERELTRDSRYPSSQPQQLVAPPSSQSRRDRDRDRDDYSPHRGGGNNRRVLNAM